MMYNNHLYWEYSFAAAGSVYSIMHYSGRSFKVCLGTTAQARPRQTDWRSHCKVLSLCQAGETFGAQLIKDLLLLQRGMSYMCTRWRSLFKYRESIILTTLVLPPFLEYCCLCSFLKTLRFTHYHYNRKVFQIKHPQLANQGQRHPRAQIPSSPMN